MQNDIYVWPQEIVNWDKISMHVDTMCTGC